MRGCIYSFPSTTTNHITTITIATITIATIDAITIATIATITNATNATNATNITIATINIAIHIATIITTWFNVNGKFIGVFIIIH